MKRGAEAHAATERGAQWSGERPAGRPGNPQFPFPRFPIWPGNGEGIPDSRSAGNRESGNGPFPDSAGKRESGSRLAANREIGDTLRCEYSWAGCSTTSCLKSFKCRFWPPPTFLLQLPRTGRWRMTTRTPRWRTMGRTLRTMSTQTLMPRHVHNKDPLSKYAHADRMTSAPGCQ